MNTWAIARVFQPEMPGLFFEVLSNGKAWILVLLGPIFAVLPDFVIGCFMKVFALNPVMKMIMKEKVYDGDLPIIITESKQ